MEAATNPIHIFISGRMRETDDDRFEVRDSISRLGSHFAPFTYERLPTPPIVFPSDAESKIARSQAFILVANRTTSPRIVDEFHFARRLGMSCYVLARTGVDRRPDLSEFLRTCGAPIYSFGHNAASISEAVAAALHALLAWQPIASKGKLWLSSVVSAIVAQLQKDPDLVFALSPREFEEVVAELISAEGHEVVLTPQTRDGGRDIIVRQSFNLFFPALIYVETKLWRTPVGTPTVQQLLGVGTSHNVNGVMIVTASRFAETVRSYLNECRLQDYCRLVDGADLPLWYRRYSLR